jgi:hypothetical protein
MNFDIERLKNNIIFSIMFSSIKLQYYVFIVRAVLLGTVLPQ